MKKKLAILMSAALLIASLAGCGQKSGGNASGGNAGSNCGGAGFPAGKNIEIIVGFAAGSATDLNARMLATYLEDELGTSVTIANREGGGGEIGWTALANAKADGYTIGVINSPAFQLPIQNPDTCKFTIDSFIPLGNMVTDPGVILVGADSPINNIEDLVAAAKANPGGVTVSVTGMNTSEARAINTLAKTFDVQFQLIPYDGSTEGINHRRGLQGAQRPAARRAHLWRAGPGLQPVLHAYLLRARRHRSRDRGRSGGRHRRRYGESRLCEAGRGGQRPAGLPGFRLYDPGLQRSGRPVESGVGSDPLGLILVAPRR